jgi:CheY-like chemotaxis protein
MTGKKFRVLLAETAPGEAAESLRWLYPGPESALELSVVSTLPTLVATIELASPETIFFDLALGKPDPLEAVRRVHCAAPAIPLVVFADVADKSNAVRCVSEGAIDYLLKGFMDTRTMERVPRTALERNTLEGLADLLRDQLTGLYNRDGLTTLATRSMETALRSGGTLVLLCALIENYSSLQEELGSVDCEHAVRETFGFHSIEKFRERSGVVCTPVAHAKAQCQRLPGFAALVVYGQPRFHTLAEYRRARSCSIHGKGPELRIAEPGRNIAAPEAAGE